MGSGPLCHPLQGTETAPRCCHSGSSFVPRRRALSGAPQGAAPAVEPPARYGTASVLARAAGPGAVTGRWSGRGCGWGSPASPVRTAGRSDRVGSAVPRRDGVPGPGGTPAGKDAAVLGGTRCKPPTPERHSPIQTPGAPRPPPPARSRSRTPGSRYRARPGCAHRRPAPPPAPRGRPRPSPVPPPPAGPAPPPPSPSRPRGPHSDICRFRSFFTPGSQRYVPERELPEQDTPGGV